MRRIGLLLTFVIVLVLSMAAPAHAAGRAPEHDEHTTDRTARAQSGHGMNRQGGPSEHPGTGWRDPGQDQGSPSNVADPDCAGNRTRSAQATNIGACDDANGAADKPGGAGGFDVDRDWNNGCGNDTDFEDDNNGQCRGPSSVLPRATPPPSNPPPNPPSTPTRGTSEEKPPTKPPVTPPSKPPSQRPSTNPEQPRPATPPEVAVPRPADTEPPAPVAPPLGVPVTPQEVDAPISRPLPVTGATSSADLASVALALITTGSVLIRYERRRR